MPKVTKLLSDGEDLNLDFTNSEIHALNYHTSLRLKEASLGIIVKI